MLIKQIVVSIIFSISCLISCKQESKKREVSTESSVKIEKLPYYNSQDFAPTWLPSEEELNTFHKIPDFNFISQLGHEVSNKTLKGNIYIASFFFTTCPNICLKLTENMRELQKTYTNDSNLKLISHTVMPSVDTVEVLKEYGERQDINPQQWYLVTGNKEKIYELAREAYFADDLYKQINDKNRFVHTENLILVDKNGHIRGVYNGTLPLEINRIKRHIKILKNE